ncbi:hypothetical protein MUK42_36416 [Musa troglodytarum]|uniref:Uncharacterized protein n=1 Tax=Musa troglodytarum TaxID=320322 RepID=A0A9E7I3B9_9LILI|nr:hypothetical protein MUK42_36416 [Musa troglodytarum]
MTRSLRPLTHRGLALAPMAEKLYCRFLIALASRICCLRWPTAGPLAIAGHPGARPLDFVASHRLLRCLSLANSLISTTIGPIFSGGERERSNLSLSSSTSSSLSPRSMTNQNVVVQTITVAAVANSPPLFTYPQPRASGSSAAAAIPKKYLSPVELGGGWTNGWLEAMKASSPTHAKSALLSAPAVESEQDEQSTWMITSATKGKQIVMFLDYDGTLSPIVDDPDSAFMSDTVSFPSGTA